MRLFVAIDPPGEIRDRIAAICRGLDGARWFSSEQFHLTLRFLGEVEPESAERIGKSLESVREDAFSVEFAGVGRFPPRRAPRVLWAGLETAPRLARLRESVERALLPAGIAPDERTFSPHLTIARLKDGVSAAAVDGWLERERDFRAGPFAVSAFFLYSSLLGPGGAQHRKLASYGLRAAEP